MSNITSTTKTNNFDHNKQGSPSYQITVFTKKINKLQKHFIKNKNDYHSRKGLFKAISRRKKLLTYLKKNNILEYHKITKKIKSKN